MADYDIFREQLSTKYSLYGHALWEPSPGEPNSPVNVGDVGFIRRGQFHRLFNALLSEDQPDVPAHYEQLVPRFSKHIRRSTLSSNHYCSEGIEVKLEINNQAIGPDDLEKISFSNSRRRGAVLSLPVDARREDTLAMGDFSEWIVKQIDRWFAFARDLGLGIERMEELILVTGCDHTRSWTNIAFSGSQNDTQASFGVKVNHGPPISINWQPSPERVRGAVLHRGPGGTNLPEDQCVFIRGFRVARTLWVLPKRLKAASGAFPDGEGYDDEPDTEVVSMPATTKYQDPLHLLQDFVAEQAPECDMVLIHDVDLVTIDELRQGASPESFEPDKIMDLLRRSNIETHRVSYDLSTTNSDSNTESSTVKVAMLPTTFQNWSGSRRQLEERLETHQHFIVSPQLNLAVSAVIDDVRDSLPIKASPGPDIKSLISTTPSPSPRPLRGRPLSSSILVVRPPTPPLHSPVPRLAAKFKSPHSPSLPSFLCTPTPVASSHSRPPTPPQHSFVRHRSTKSKSPRRPSVSSSLSSPTPAGSSHSRSPTPPPHSFVRRRSTKSKSPRRPSVSSSLSSPTPAGSSNSCPPTPPPHSLVQRQFTKSKSPRRFSVPSSLSSPTPAGSSQSHPPTRRPDSLVGRRSTKSKLARSPSPVSPPVLLQDISDLPLPPSSPVNIQRTQSSNFFSRIKSSFPLRPRLSPGPSSLATATQFQTDLPLSTNVLRKPQSSNILNRIKCAFAPRRPLDREDALSRTHSISSSISSTYAIITSVSHTRSATASVSRNRTTSHFHRAATI